MVPAPQALEASVLDFCRSVATQMGMEAKPTHAYLCALKQQAVSMAGPCRKALPTDSCALPLLEAALGALECATGEELKGEKRFGHGAQMLANRWRQCRKTTGARSLERLPELKNLALLYELAGLRSSRWRDEALEIRMGAARDPDPPLEKDLVGAVEDHYGPWLTVVELEPMLCFCHHLTRVWLTYPEPAAMTRQVLRLGLKPDAFRVWRLAARTSDEAQRRELAALLTRLDPETLLQAVDSAPSSEGDLNALLSLAEALQGTPLEAPMQGLLKRLDTQASKTDSAGSRGNLRRRLARLMEDWDGWSELLRRELTATGLDEAGLTLLGEAETLLKAHPDDALLETGSRWLQAYGQAQGKATPSLCQTLEIWSGLLRVANHPEEAEGLLSLRLSLEDPQGQDRAARCELLARLARWADLESLLGPPEGDESAQRLGWRFRAALGQGQGKEALRWVEAWLARCSSSTAGPEAPMLPGLCWAIPRVPPEALQSLVARNGARLLPGQEALLVREPWRILVALDPEAPASLLPEKAEEALRWRWSHLPSASRAQRLASLVEDAEHQLGESHLLVAELLEELGSLKGEGGLACFEQASRIRESKPDQELARAKLHVAMAASCSLWDGAGLERNLMKAIELLERVPRGEGEAETWVGDMPGLLLLHLWREQRLDDLLALGPRVKALAQRWAKGGGQAAELDEMMGTMARAARLQSRLRSAGLP